jgi:hypothetical protein
VAVALDGNNPGGILDGAFAQSQHGYIGRNGPYAAFKTLADGLNAMRVLITSYIRRGFDTATKIATKWAPPPRKDAPITKGNNPKLYAEKIAGGLKVGVNNVIPIEKALAVAIAMAKVENPAFPALWAKEQEHV